VARTRRCDRSNTLDLDEVVDVTLPRGSAITGGIEDEYGDPAAAVMVRAVRHRHVDGQRRLTPISEGIEVLGNAGDITDDLGQFRIYGLAPGDYYVSALYSPPGEPAGRTGYPPTYYPGTAAAADARRITVRPGEEAQDISLTEGGTPSISLKLTRQVLTERRPALSSRSGPGR
jgi:hypothetical protein